MACFLSRYDTSRFLAVPTLKRQIYTNAGLVPYRSVGQLKQRVKQVFRKLPMQKFDFIPSVVQERWKKCITHKGERW